MLVALFPLLFTISGNVFCSKFGGVWETLWIFKVARWTHDRCIKINKSPTVSNNVGASAAEIWTAILAQSLTVDTLTNSQSFIFGDSNWKFCSRLPCRHPKTWLSEKKRKNCFYFWVNKIKTCWIHKNTANWGKYEVSWNFLYGVYYRLFKVVYWDHLTQLLPFAKGFCNERAVAGLGPSGLTFRMGESTR